MEEQKVKAEEYISLSKELYYKRKLMGISAIDFANDNGFNQGNYSRMENGMLNPSKALKIMNDLFVVWRAERIEYLSKEIIKLKAIMPK